MHAEASESLKASLKEISKPEKEKELKEFALKVFKWNKTTNLVSKNSTLENIYHHIIDSAHLYPLIENNSYIDVGSGAGFPGLVISILGNEAGCLLEPANKKASFLRHCLAHFGIQKTKVLQKRLEDLETIKEDVLISRAFAEPKKILSLARKKTVKDQKILLMVSEQQARQEDKNDWKYTPSAASKILGKKTGFLEINPTKK